MSYGNNYELLKSLEPRPTGFNGQRRTALLPRVFGAMAGCEALAYTAVGNAYVTLGKREYLDNFENDMRDIIFASGKDQEVSPGLVVNLGLRLRSHKSELDEHFDAISSGRNIENAYILSITETRVVWEVEYE